MIIVEDNIEVVRYTGTCRESYWNLEVELWAECWRKAHLKEWNLKAKQMGPFWGRTMLRKYSKRSKQCVLASYEVIHWGSLWAVPFSHFSFVHSFFLSVYNWHIVLCMIKVYSTMIWLTYIIKWLPRKLSEYPSSHIDTK